MILIGAQIQTRLKLCYLSWGQESLARMNILQKLFKNHEANCCRCDLTSQCVTVSYCLEYILALEESFLSPVPSCKTL